MDIAYYGFSDGISNSIVRISLFFSSEKPYIVILYVYSSVFV